MPDMQAAIPLWLLFSRVQYLQGQSLLQNGPTQLLQSFNRFPDHQTDIERGSTHPTQLEIKVDHFSKVLQTCLVDATSDPALMLNFKCGIENIPTIDLTSEEVVLHYPPLKGNIAEELEDDLDVPTTALGHSSHQQAVCDESSSSVALSHNWLWCGSSHIICFSLKDHSYSFPNHRQAGVLPSVPQ